MQNCNCHFPSSSTLIRHLAREIIEKLEVCLAQWLLKNSRNLATELSSGLVLVQTCFLKEYGNFIAILMRSNNSINIIVFENHQKKSHSTVRAKRATFTFWVDQSSLKLWSLQSNIVTRHVTFNRTEIGGKCQKA